METNSHNPCRLRRSRPAPTGGATAGPAPAGGGDGGGAGGNGGGLRGICMSRRWIGLASVVVITLWLGAFKQPRLGTMMTAETTAGSLPSSRITPESSESAGSRFHLSKARGRGADGADTDADTGATPDDAMAPLDPSSFGAGIAAPGIAAGAAPEEGDGVGVADAEAAGMELLPAGTSVGRWRDQLSVLQAVNRTRSFEYIILRNHESMPASLHRGDHGDVDIYVSSKQIFSQFIGCTLTSKTGSKAREGPVQCWVKGVADRALFKFDVHGPDDAQEYYPVEWGLDMLSSRVLSTPSTDAAVPGLSGVYRSTDVHYYYSLLYHLAYHGKTSVKPDYVALLRDMKAKVGASAPVENKLDDLTAIKAAVDAFLRCKDYQPVHKLMDSEIPFKAQTPECVQ